MFTEEINGITYCYMPFSRKGMNYIGRRIIRFIGNSLLPMAIVLFIVSVHFLWGMVSDKQLANYTFFHIGCAIVLGINICISFFIFITRKRSDIFSHSQIIHSTALFCASAIIWFWVSMCCLSISGGINLLSTYLTFAIFGVSLITSVFAFVIAVKD